MRQNPYSLLCRFYGVYKIKVKYMKPIKVIVMDNLMGNRVDKIVNIYDLKGSTFHRINDEVKPGAILKDLNFKKNKQDRLRVSKEV